MDPIRFIAEDHMEMVNSWCDKWKMSHFPDGWLPTVGYIVPDVAAAWIYISDSNVAWMENVISNPDSDAAARDKSIDDIVRLLESAAKQCGTKWMLGLSDNKDVLARATDVHGFRVCPRTYNQIIKNL
jgi:hypothetical protein